MLLHVLATRTASALRFYEATFSGAVFLNPKLKFLNINFYCMPSYFSLVEYQIISTGSFPHALFKLFTFNKPF